MKKELILDFLNELYPDAECELNYNNDYELLINIALSAQTTDKKVNEISEDLFLRFSSISLLSKADIKEVENIIKPLGLSKIKSKNIVNCARQIIDTYEGVIPNEFEKLIKLSGVGKKTANVFLTVFYNIPTFPVDTHVKRVANRLGISSTEDVDIIETDLMNFFEKDTWVKLHHQLIFFGRYFCTSKNPNCSECKLKCVFYKKREN